MRRFGDFTGLDLFQGVEALAGAGEGVHEMHAIRVLATNRVFGEGKGTLCWLVLNWLAAWVGSNRG